jgi:hypothetical protein
MGPESQCETVCDLTPFVIWKCCRYAVEGFESTVHVSVYAKVVDEEYDRKGLHIIAVVIR